MQCSYCGKKANVVFVYKKKFYCRECQQKLETDNAAPWQDKCGKCHEVVDLTTDVSCPNCGNSLISNLKKSVNSNSSPSNSPNKSNIALYIGLAIAGVVLVGIVVYFLTKKKGGEE